MKETFKFLKENTKVNYMATINGDKPSNRPFGDPVLFDNKIYILTSLIGGTFPTVKIKPKMFLALCHHDFCYSSNFR